MIPATAQIVAGLVAEALERTKSAATLLCDGPRDLRDELDRATTSLRIIAECLESLGSVIETNTGQAEAA
jgi:hypothetical protein